MAANGKTHSNTELAHYQNSRQVFGFKGLAGKVFRNQRLTRSVRFAQDFGSGLPLRSRPLNAPT